VSFLTAQNPVFKHAFFQGFFNKVGDEFEMLAGLVGDAALGMASVISGEPIAAASPGEGMKKSFALGQFAKTKIEQTGAMTIHKNDAQAGEGASRCARGFR